jgi:hypothetical protein
MGDQTLMNRSGEQRDAVPANLLAEVLTGERKMAHSYWHDINAACSWFSSLIEIKPRYIVCIVQQE